MPKEEHKQSHIQCMHNHQGCSSLVCMGRHRGKPRKTLGLGNPPWGQSQREKKKKNPSRQHAQPKLSSPNLIWSANKNTSILIAIKPNQEKKNQTLKPKKQIY